MKSASCHVQLARMMHTPLSPSTRCPGIDPLMVQLIHSRVRAALPAACPAADTTMPVVAAVQASVQTIEN
jgi:hypothetical protein